MSNAQLPPGPGKLAFAKMMIDPSVTLADLWKKYGDPFSLTTTFGKMVVAVAPAGNKSIFTADPDSMVPSAGDALDFVFKKSMLLTHGEEHRRARKLLMPPFHGARMRAYGDLMRETARRRAADFQHERPFKMIDLTQAITLDVIIEAVFGVRGDDRVAQFRAGILALFEGFSPLLFLKPLRRNFFGVGPWARFARNYEVLRTLVFALIAEHRATLAGREDILSLLIAAKDEAGQGLSDQEIMDQLLTIVFAGHETTAVMLAWTFYYLHRDADVLSRLRAELSTLGENPESEAIVKLPLLEGAINEALRLQPPVHVIHRRLVKPMQLLGYDLLPGTVVAAGAYATHRIESLYPDPEKYVPQRFVNRTYTPFEFLPWGGGARRCLGAAFAMYEMKLVLYTMLKNYELRLLQKGPVKLEHRPGTVGPKGGIPMQFVRR